MEKLCYSFMQCPRHGKDGLSFKAAFPEKFYEWIRESVNPNVFHRLLLFFVQFSSFCFFSLFCLFFISFFFAYLFGRVVFILILSVVWLAFKLIGHVKWLKLDWSSIFHCSPPTHYKRNELSAWSHTFLSIPLDSLMSFDPQLSAVSSKSH